MAGFNNKLGDWFKQVDKSAEKVKAKKQTPGTPQDSASGTAEPRLLFDESQPQALVAEAQSAVVSVESMERVSDIAVADREESLTSSPRPIERADPDAPALFEDAELPPVEDFFSFMERSDAAETVEPPVIERDRNTRLMHLSEGTGEPKPIEVPEAQAAPPVSEPRPEELAPKSEAPMVVRAEPEPVAQQEPAPVIRPVPAPVAAVADDEPGLQEKWDRMPHHLQTLFEAGAADEVAQNSYKTFKESRGDLIQRLLDPQISLEEAARILNVCPTTVRRYTNRGVLKHYRTAGNQRRFKLSDVLTFMESGASPEPAE